MATPKSKRFLVGLTGKNASGKGEVAQILKKHGYAYRSLSDVLREEAENRKLEPSRENLIALGKELRERSGPGVLAKMTLERIGDTPHVIDSIRNPVEIELLRKAGRLLLFAVEAPIEIRFARAFKRGRNENASTLDEFREMEEREHSSRNPAQQLDLCIELADETISNEGSLDDLEDRVEKALVRRSFPWS